MAGQRVYLDDIYASEASKGSVFRAVVMMAQEARFINDQARQGYLQLDKKPTTIAMDKFKNGKLSISEKSHEELYNDLPEARSAATTDESANSDFDV